jgi:hypothetical protein
MKLTLITIHVGVYNEILILYNQLQIIQAVQRKGDFQSEIAKLGRKSPQGVLVFFSCVQQREEGYINSSSAHCRKENPQRFPSGIMIQKLSREGGQIGMLVELEWFGGVLQ